VRQADRRVRDHARPHRAEDAELRHECVAAIGVLADIADLARQPVDLDRVIGDRSRQAVRAHRRRNAGRVVSLLRH